jgi:hypothetical protein
MRAVRTFEDRLLLALVAYSLLILFLTPFPPMTDLPSHLATAAVLRDYAGAPHAGAYAFNGWFNSNRLVAALAALSPRALPMMLVGKLLLAAWLLLPLVGRRFLATWRPEAAVWSPLLVLLSFCNLFNTGYVPYLVGMPLALLPMSMPWARADSPPWRSLALPALCLLAALYAHVLAFAAGAAGVLLATLAVRPSRRGAAKRVLVMLPSLALLVGIYLQNRGHADISNDEGSHRTLLWIARQKVVSFADAFVTFGIEAEIVVIGVPLLVIGALCAREVLRRRGRPAGAPLLIAAVFCGIFLLCPSFLLGAERTDGRFIPAAFLAVCALLPAWEPRRAPLRRGLTVALVLPALLWAHWNYARASRVIEPIHEALLSIPHDQVVSVVFEKNPLGYIQRVAPLVHTTGYYMVARRGVGTDALIVHGETRWHAVVWRPGVPRENTYTVVLEAERARDLVPPAARHYDDGANMVVRAPEARLLAEAGVTRPSHFLFPVSIRHGERWQEMFRSHTR